MEQPADQHSGLRAAASGTSAVSRADRGSGADLSGGGARQRHPAAIALEREGNAPGAAAGVLESNRTAHYGPSEIQPCGGKSPPGGSSPSRPSVPPGGP